MINKFFNIIQLIIVLLALFVSRECIGFLLILNAIPFFLSASYCFGSLIKEKNNWKINLNFLLKWIYITLTISIFANINFDLLYWAYVILLLVDCLIINLEYHFKEIDTKEDRVASRKAAEIIDRKISQRDFFKIPNEMKHISETTVTILLCVVCIGISSFCGTFMDILCEDTLKNELWIHIIGVIITSIACFDMTRRYKISLESVKPINGNQWIIIPTGGCVGLFFLGIIPHFVKHVGLLQNIGLEVGIKIVGFGLVGSFLFALFLVLKIANKSFIMYEKKR